MAGSINQNAYSSALPNFRNLGILLRILLMVNLAAIAAAMVESKGPNDFWPRLLDVSIVVQPLLMLSVLALVLLNDLLKRLPYYLGAAAVLVLELALATVLYVYGRPLLPVESTWLERYWLLTFLVTLMLLLYFDLRGRALSPAISEARLQALQARIRPHFLFNSINAVLSLIREDPKRAEGALEDMADLFRVVMADNRELTPLVREVELCRDYLALEQLRLGDRLRVDWHVDNMPGDARIPPLVLQPLLENAVYHGIEPRTAPGVISINVYLARDQVHAVLRNPYEQEGRHHAGNKMALANIRERLQLHFDAEASLTTRVTDDAYQVHITMPYVKDR
ncbi:MAG: two-component system sensor ATPase [Burkholderiales bacterium]|jgi:two-component system sensor histidine kinase AlgZ|nr:two-component system sensor ATPase [Burkholderiales bacterium]